MLTIVLAAVTGLGVEIGIASWNIRRANKYRRREYGAEQAREQAADALCNMERRLECLDDYASKVSQVLSLLVSCYKRSLNFEKEANLGKADAEFKKLKEALGHIPVLVETDNSEKNTAESTENTAGFALPLLNQVINDFKEEGENEASDPGKSNGDAD
jgi:hypothetical protein